MPNIFVDTHSHLFAQEFDLDRNAIVLKAIDQGVKKILLPNIDMQSIQSMIDLNNSFPENCLMMFGLHPSSVNDDFIQNLDIIYPYFSKYKGTVGVGEIGLDYYWDTTFKSQQLEAFKIQIQWAMDLQLPMSIHTRGENSFEDAISMIESTKLENPNQSLSGAFHCFGGSIQEAKRVLNLENFYLGIGGVSTFKNSKIPDLINNIGWERIILETDSPYLAPVPYRGKRNDSSYIPIIARHLSEYCQIGVKEISAITSKNANDLFKLAL